MEAFEYENITTFPPGFNLVIPQSWTGPDFHWEVTSEATPEEKGSF